MFIKSTKLMAYNAGYSGCNKNAVEFVKELSRDSGDNISVLSREYRKGYKDYMHDVLYELIRAKAYKKINRLL